MGVYAVANMRVGFGWAWDAMLRSSYREQLLARGKSTLAESLVCALRWETPTFFVPYKGNQMPHFKVDVEFSAKVTGKYTVVVEADAGTPTSEVLSSAEETASHEIDQLILNESYNHDLEVDNCDSSITNTEMSKCSECNGRKYKIDILDGGAGLIKVGPCPSCQQIPTTKDVCEHVIELLEEQHNENDEED